MTVVSESSNANPHLNDAILKPFLAPNFSPVDYLNTHLPSLSKASHQAQHAQTSPATTPSLTTLASQTQSHISALNTQTARLSATLTALTDDILRTGSRLAYEVELVRGEAVSLAETLSSTGPLYDSIIKFVPEGLDNVKNGAISNDTDEPSSSTTNTKNASAIATSTTTNDTALSNLHIKDDQNSNKTPIEINNTSSTNDIPTSTNDPPAALSSLRTLLHVRSQLQSTIQIFNLALSFPFPPSLLRSTAANAASALISVSAPTPSSLSTIGDNGQSGNAGGMAMTPAAKEEQDAETEGQACLARFRNEIAEMLMTSTSTTTTTTTTARLPKAVEEQQDGEEKALARIRELRNVCLVWKGTSEERPRMKWVQGLADGVEAEIEGRRRNRREKERERERQEEMRDRLGDGAARGGSSAPAPGSVSSSGSVLQPPTGRSGTPLGSSGGGFLRRLRDEIYAD